MRNNLSTATVLTAIFISILAHNLAEAQTPTADLEAQIKAMQAQIEAQKPTMAPATAVPAKGDGTVSVKVRRPVVSLSGGDAENVGVAVESAIVARLSSEPHLRPIVSSRNDTADIAGDAYTLAISITKKERGGFLRKLPIGNLPIPGLGSKLPIGTLQIAMQLIKAKDRVSFHYTLVDANQRSVVDQAFDVTAEADGHDVWTKGVARIAEAVVPLMPRGR